MRKELQDGFEVINATKFLARWRSTVWFLQNGSEGRINTGVFRLEESAIP